MKTTLRLALFTAVSLASAGCGIHISGSSTEQSIKRPKTYVNPNDHTEVKREWRSTTAFCEDSRYTKSVRLLHDENIYTMTFVTGDVVEFEEPYRCDPTDFGRIAAVEVPSYRYVEAKYGDTTIKCTGRVELKNYAGIDKDNSESLYAPSRCVLFEGFTSSRGERFSAGDEILILRSL